MASLIPDSVRDTFSDLLATYGDIEALKAQKSLVRAQQSLLSASLPDAYSNPQARALDYTLQPLGAGGGSISPGVMIGVGLVALVAVVLIAQK